VPDNPAPEPPRPEPVRPPSPPRAPEPPRPAADAASEREPDPFSVEDIEAEFARLLGRPTDRS
jgi:hypothetical protein